MLIRSTIVALAGNSGITEIITTKHTEVTNENNTWNYRICGDMYSGCQFLK